MHCLLPQHPAETATVPAAAVPVVLLVAVGTLLPGGQETGNSVAEAACRSRRAEGKSYRSAEEGRPCRLAGIPAAGMAGR